MHENVGCEAKQGKYLWGFKKNVKDNIKMELNRAIL
jgi:hypothetical protein